MVSDGIGMLGREENSESSLPIGWFPDESILPFASKSDCDKTESENVADVVVVVVVGFTVELGKGGRHRNA